METIIQAKAINHLLILYGPGGAVLEFEAFPSGDSYEKRFNSARQAAAAINHLIRVQQ